MTPVVPRAIRRAAAAAARALLLALLLALPAAAQETPPAPAPEGPQGPIAAEDTAASDAAIAQRIRGILRELDGFGAISVEVSEGVVRFGGETPDEAAQARLDEIANRVEGVVAVENRAVATADVAERLDPAIRRIADRASRAVALLPILGVAILAGAAVFLLGLFVAARAWPWDRLAPNAFVANVYRQIVRIAFGVMGLVLALDIMGAVALLGTVLGAAGIFGLAVGFAVRDTVENFIASVLLSFRQPFAPGDMVEIEGDLGKVIRLTSRATILLGVDGNQISLPNATVYKGRLVNMTRNPERRFEFEIGVASDAALGAVRDLVAGTVADLPFTLAQPAPLVWIDRIGDGAVFLKVTGWIDQRGTDVLRARGEAIRLVKAAVEAAGVEVPDTTYRIDLRGSGGTVTEAAYGPPAPPPPPEDTAPADVSDAGTDAALERIVHAERREAGGDLLDPAAPRE